MKILLCIGFLTTFLSFQTLAQLPVQLSPTWEQSFGNREHTNRDELVQMVKDSLGNLILLGFTEGDSVFSDVSVQKISPEGTLLWDYRFDSNNQNDYDIPLKMALDGSGDITIFGVSYGIVSFFSAQKSNGFLFKLSNDGVLQWQVGFDTLNLLPPHESAINCDAYADSDGNFMVCYTAYQEFGDRPTYFLKFSPTGTILQTLIKYDIGQGLGGGSSAVGQAIDSSGNFHFIEYNENNYPKHAIRNINPHNGTEQYNQIDLNSLPIEDSIRYIYLEWQQIWVDDFNETYTANNLNTGALAPTFFLSKIKPNGLVRYIFSPKDSIDIHFSSLKPWRGYAYVTGSYRPKYSNVRVAFLWKIDENGEIAYQSIESTPHHAEPRFLDLINGKIYWVTEDIETGLAKLKELDAIDLDIQWEYSLQKNQNFIFTGSNFVKLADGKAALGGTLRKEKQPGSAYLSEEDFYVETFTPVPNELYAQYQMTGLGTTNVESNAFSFDPEGNIYVRTIEVDGPEYFLIQMAPRKCYYYKFSPSGNLLWVKLSEHQPYSSYGLPTFYFDHQGNAYSLAYGTTDSLLLVKISAQGEIQGSYSIYGFRNLFIDNQNRLHLTYGVGNDNLPNLVVLDQNFQTLRTGPSGLVPIKIFQLPMDNSVYYYLEDKADWGETTFRVLLYHEDQMLWERVFTFDSPEYQSFSSHDLDAATGTLVAYSIWRNNTGFFELAYHRFTLANDYNTQVLTSLDNGNFPSTAAYLANGNTFAVYSTILELYDTNFQLIQSIPISDAPAGGYFFKLHNNLFRSRMGLLDVYNGDNQSSFSFTHPSFYFDPARIGFNIDNQLISADIIGDWLGGGYDFGWRWYRSRVQAFDLSSWISSPAEEPLLGIAHLSCSPNPVADKLQINLEGMEGQEIQISLANSTGTIVASQHLYANNSSVTNIPVSTLPNGSYFLKAVASAGTYWVQKIVVLKP